jgi:hypothetical protein
MMWVIKKPVNFAGDVHKYYTTHSIAVDNAAPFSTTPGNGPQLVGSSAIPPVDMHGDFSPWRPLV